ncbi:Hypothetical predicted protein, partial [Xyrichtys novacula]
SLPAPLAVMDCCCLRSEAEAGTDSRGNREKEKGVGGTTVPLDEMKVRSSKHHTLTADISPIKVLGEEVNRTRERA